MEFVAGKFSLLPRNVVMIAFVCTIVRVWASLFLRGCVFGESDIWVAVLLPIKKKKKNQTLIYTSNVEDWSQAIFFSGVTFHFKLCWFQHVAYKTFFFFFRMNFESGNWFQLSSLLFKKFHRKGMGEVCQHWFFGKPWPKEMIILACHITSWLIWLILII